MTTPNPSPPSSRRWWQLERWRYGGAAFCVGVLYSAAAMWTGLDIRIDNRDVSTLVSVLIEISFGALGYLLGITAEARRGERRAAAESEARLQQLADLRARLAQTEKLASLGQLSSAVAHEVRNPLAILRSMAQNLAEELPPESADARQSCADMIEEIDRLARVTSRLVDFARPVRPLPAPVDLDGLIDRLRLLAEPLLRPRRLRLVVDGPAGATVDADADLLCQVLLGLVRNASDASPERGVLRLGWSASDDGLVMTLHDDGDGIPDDLRERVFEPFFTTRDDGHGLGLAIARQIVEAHGGRLIVDPEAPRGAGFRLSLPTAETTRGAAGARVA